MANGEPRRRRIFTRNGTEYEYDRTLSDETIDSIERIEAERNRAEEDRQRRYEQWAVEFTRGNSRARDNPLREEEERAAQRRVTRERSDRENFVASQAAQPPPPSGASVGATRSPFIWVLLIIAIVADAADFIPGIQLPLIGDAIGDVIPFLGILFFGRARWTALLSAVEFIPAVVTDFLPMHTIAVLAMFWATRSSAAPQPGQPMRINLTSPRTYRWVIFLILFLLLMVGIAYWDVIKKPLDKTTKSFTKNPDSPISKFFRNIGTLWQYLAQAVTGSVQWFDRFFERQIAIATGDYYTGAVDANAEKKLGVYLEDVRPSSEEFEDTEAVTIWATLSALTLDQDKNVTVRLGCYLDEEGGPYGVVDPEFLPSLINLDRQDVTCAFNRGDIPEGSDTATLTAFFNFETQAYLKAYFMDKQRLQALRRGGSDPLMFYDVQDTNPTAIHTNGPVMIGMEMLEPLVGISDQQETKFRIGITLENLWDGKIAQVHNLTLKIPPSMTLEDCDANKRFVQVACQGEECEDGKYQHVYRLLPTTTRKLVDIEDYESFACRVKIDATAREAALGNVPLATHYFKVIATYDYELHESTSVTVKPSTGFNVYLVPSQASLRKQDGNPMTMTCRGKHSDIALVTADAQFFRLPKNSPAGAAPTPMTEKVSTVCGETCEYAYPLRAPLEAGDTLLCTMTNPTFESQSSESGLRFSCLQQCGSVEEPSAFNDCMVQCQDRLRAGGEEFEASDALTITNSKPHLQFRTAATTLTSIDTIHIEIVVTDPDLHDRIGVGFSFSGIDITPQLRQELPCVPSADEQRCAFAFDFNLVGQTASESVEVTMIPTDGHTVGKREIARFTVHQAAPVNHTFTDTTAPGCDPRFEKCPTF